MISGAAVGMVIKLFWSFVLGAVSASALSISADRYGSKVTGVIAGFPATIAASLLILAWSQGPSQAAAAARVVPMMMGIFALYLASYCFLLRWSFWWGVLGSVGVWLAFALLPLRLGAPPLFLSAGIFLVSFLAAFLTVEYGLRVGSQIGSVTRLSLRQVVSRMLTGGMLVASAVFLGTVVGPLAGGITVTFPAVTLSTLVLTYQAGGIRLSSAVAKSIMLGGSLSGALYALGVTLFYPALGLVAGTLAAAFVLLIGTAIGYEMLRRAS